MESFMENLMENFNEWSTVVATAVGAVSVYVSDTWAKYMGLSKKNRILVGAGVFLGIIVLATVLN